MNKVLITHMQALVSPSPSLSLPHSLPHSLTLSLALYLSLFLYISHMQTHDYESFPFLSFSNLFPPLCPSVCPSSNQ